MPSPDPRVGVVMATRNRAGRLPATLKRLTALPERPRIVLVDNGSTDDTVAVVRRHFPHVAVEPLPENRGGAARTVGARRLATPYVAFADDDSWWAPGALARAADLFDRHPRLAVLAACVLVGPEERLDPTCAVMAASPLPAADDLPGPPVLGFLACGAVVRRTAYLDAGGFEGHYGIGGEEHLLAIDLAAAGWGLAYVDDVIAHHHPQPGGDRAGRRRVELRNALWSAWLRRPLRTAVRKTAGLLRPALADAAGRAALGDAVRGLPWVLRQRRPVPPSLEQALRLLER